MHAVDTNVLVRLLIGDDAAQSKRAAALFKKESIFIPKTVLLETEWVLRRLYRLERATVVGSLRKLGGLGNVEFEQPLVVAQALQWCEGGMDFADALHLASSHVASKFATFDRQMKKDAPPESKPVVRLL
jgi:predicted nucleic-acid-binding protein